MPGIFPEGVTFCKSPGQTNVPERILRALGRPTIDHRGQEFARMTKEILAGLRDLIKTSGRVGVYPSSGTGASEAPLLNTLSRAREC